ncbi:sugar transporter SWEET1-like [Zerene cesonia]|uniref:sugar transporter SWEET1-like n=1 Tax=Zerene cesonia TaxID=33412 RepID=UPI0018E599AB|nr:sugar transporter SWEET1-like [Zerene cesonia]
MEALSNILQPYKSIVGTVAAVVTIGQMFSGSFLCYDIYKQRSTKGIGIMPFAGGLIISAPLLDLKTIIKNKSTEGMPFPIIFSGSIVTFMWLLYGIILNNSILVLQNSVAFSLCTVQLALFVIYPSKPKEEKKKAKKAD